jgi:uncharacterized protein
VFDLRSVKLAVGEQHREPLAVTIEPFTIGGEPYASPPEPVTADFAVTRLRNGWLFDERFDAAIHGPCHRCLSDAVVTLSVHAREFQATQPEPGAEDDMTCEYLSDGELDTDSMARDAVQLAMPLQVVCRKDCAGLCPRCGANRNDGPCGCRDEEPQHGFGVLRDLFDTSDLDA